MKELSIEEKAYDGNYKAYTELINRIEDVKEAIKKQNYGIAMDILCKPYPQFQVITHSELKESEDEKIREWLIEVVEEVRKANPTNVEHNGMCSKSIAWLEKQSTPQVRTGLEWVNTIDDACDKRYLEEYAHGEYCHEQSFKWGFQEGVDWLEKQGKQKPVEEIEPTPIFRIGDVLKRKGKDYTFIVDRIQGGYYHCYHNNGAFFPIEEQGNWELVEQKPAWSEEDENHVESILSTIECCKAQFPNAQAVVEAYNADIDWLKSLKERYTWKPSGEQLKILDKTIGVLDRMQLFGGRNALIDLKHDLKKLREE